MLNPTKKSIAKKEKKKALKGEENNEIPFDSERVHIQDVMPFDEYNLPVIIGEATLFETFITEPHLNFMSCLLDRYDAYLKMLKNHRAIFEKERLAVLEDHLKIIEDLRHLMTSVSIMKANKINVAVHIMLSAPLSNVPRGTMNAFMDQLEE